MRKFLLASAGLLVLFAPLQVAWGSDPPIYDTVHEIVSKEFPADALETFVATVLNDTNIEKIKDRHVTISKEDVDDALKNGANPQLCEKLKAGFTSLCTRLVTAMRSVASREQEVIVLGHELQVIATSYEEPIVGFSMQPDDLAASYMETLRVWGLTEIQTGSTLRSIRVLPPPDGIEEQTDPLNSALENLKDGDSEERLIAAVWRYLYGVKFVEDESPSENPDSMSGPKTERQYLFARVTEIESALHELMSVLESKVIPPLEEREVALFLIPLDSKGRVKAWAYFRDTTNDAPGEPLPQKDVGLRWTLPLEPVVPSILEKEEKKPILAGTYPPAPVRNTRDKTVLAKGKGGLCKSLSGSMGYLCHPRPVRTGGRGECQEPVPDPKPDTIILSTCTPSNETPGSGSALVNDPCVPMRENLSAGEKACDPGYAAMYPYTVLGHSCYVRECSERAFGHNLIPGREPLVSQETVYPWHGCISIPPEREPISLPPSLNTFPSFPEYNPAARAQEFNILYCGETGEPPMSPSSLCKPNVLPTLTHLQVVWAGMGLQLKQNKLDGPQREIIDVAESMGSDLGSALYEEYLREVSTALNGTLSAATELLTRLAASRFPDLMCPLEADAYICN